MTDTQTLRASLREVRYALSHIETCAGQLWHELMALEDILDRECIDDDPRQVVLPLRRHAA